MPVLEAMAAGTPVVKSTAVLREGGGDTVWYAEPDDPAAIAGAIKEALCGATDEPVARPAARNGVFMDPSGNGAGDAAEGDRVSEHHGHEEAVQAGNLSLRGMITPRTQIVLIAIGIALFNVVLVGFLVYLIVVY